MSKSLSRDTIEVRYRYLHRTTGIMGTFIILAVPCWSLNDKKLICRIRKEKPINNTERYAIYSKQRTCHHINICCGSTL